MHPILALGFSLLEVLISLFILSIALLGLDATGLFSWQLQLNAYYAALAEQQLQNMEERLRLLEVSPFALEQEVALWNLENKRLLPKVKGKVSGTYPNFELSLIWGQKRAALHEEFSL